MLSFLPENNYCLEIDDLVNSRTLFFTVLTSTFSSWKRSYSRCRCCSRCCRRRSRSHPSRRRAWPWGTPSRPTCRFREEYFLNLRLHPAIVASLKTKCKMIKRSLKQNRVVITHPSITSFMSATSASRLVILPDNIFFSCSCSSWSSSFWNFSEKTSRHPDVPLKVRNDDGEVKKLSQK